MKTIKLYLSFCISSVILLMVGYLCVRHGFITYLFSDTAPSWLSFLINENHGLPLYYYGYKVDLMFALVVEVYVVLLCARYFSFKPNVMRYLKVVLIIVLITVMLFECGIAFIFRNPQMAEFLLIGFIRQLYWDGNYVITQMEDSFAQYDPKLAYTLKPGEFNFKNFEFDTTFEVNSLGVRDDEESLLSPEIVSLGDSYAMGWGVEQDESYAQCVEKETGMKVLNTGIASYGTVREMRMLDRVDTSAMKYVLIQYSLNDYHENSIFYHKKDITILSQSEFEKAKAAYRRELRYYPGKYTVFALSRISRGVRKTLLNVSDANFKPSDIFAHEAALYDETDPAKAFINAIMYAGETDLSEVTIIVVASAQFCHDVKNIIQYDDYPDFIENIRFIFYPDRGEKEDMYFLIDQHLNAAGHQYCANEISSVIKATTHSAMNAPKK